MRRLSDVLRDDRRDGYELALLKDAQVTGDKQKLAEFRQARAGNRAPRLIDERRNETTGY